MDPVFFLRGLVIGFSIAAPVGPIGVLCIQRTLAKGRASGLISGLGAATADALYGSIAGFGLTFLSTFLVAQQPWLRLVGGTFLIYLGVRIWFSEKSTAVVTPGVKTESLIGDYASTLALTLANPITIIFFAAVFAGLGFVGQKGSDYGTAVLLVSGVFSGSALWWILLSGGVSLFRHRFDSGKLRWVNRISGVTIATFGLIAIVSLVI